MLRRIFIVLQIYINDEKKENESLSIQLKILEWGNKINPRAAKGR